MLKTYMKPNLNLRQVESFYSVMRAGTVVGAARLMNVTQPAVSRSIALLELRVGYKLFERRGRMLVPTPEGEALYREVEPIYGSLDRIAQVAEDIGGLRAGALRIATLPSVSQTLLPNALARFLAARPKVSVYVESLSSRQVAELVATRQADIGIIELPLSRPAISIEPLAPAPTMAIIPADHRLARKRQVSIRDLADERVVLLSRHSNLRHQIDDAFAKLGVSAEVVVETPHSLVACGLAAAGVGITLVSRWSAEYVITPTLVVRPVKEELFARNAIIFPYPGARQRLAEGFAAELKKEVQSILRR